MKCGDDDTAGGVDKFKMSDVSISEVVQLLNRFVALDEISCEGDDIEDDLNSILLNPAASTI
jgi:hypothetical protein